VTDTRGSCHDAYGDDKGAGMKKFLLTVALVVVAACSNNGSQAEVKDSYEAVVLQTQLENTERRNAALTTANMKTATEVQTAALAGAEVGCAALAQMVALVQTASQTGGEMHDASWLAGWKPNSDLSLVANS
jgi:hypothetical protein